MDYGDNSLLIAMFFIAMRRLRICFLYRLVIQVRLGISGVTTQLYSWRSKSDAGSAERAAQIDMVIERGDNTINLCEMKFSEGEFLMICFKHHLFNILHQRILAVMQVEVYADHVVDVGIALHLYVSGLAVHHRVAA